MKNFRVLLVWLIIFLVSACQRETELSSESGLPDGSVYSGQMLDGKFHGNGYMQFGSGGHYKGMFEQGLFHGEGELIDAYGNIYKGEFDRGSITGKFRFVSMTDGLATYEGDMVKAKFQGEGIYKKDEITYEGSFVNGRYHGKGKLTYDDGSFYQGDFVDGVLQGQGHYLDFEGNEYTGEIADWYAHGEGELTDDNGNVLKGTFEYGYLVGEGEFIGIDGSQYKGDFDYNEFEGQGELTKADESHYVGEFSWGQFHGQGTLTYLNEETGETEIQQGIWRNGELVNNEVTGENFMMQADLALQNHQRLLEEHIERIEFSELDRPNVYFIGVAGDGRQSVFRREVEYVEQTITSKFNTQGRSLLLVNHHHSANEYPLATFSSIKTAIEGVAKKMNKEEDILILYMTSHGSQNFDFILGHDQIELFDISALQLKNILKDSGINWKVVFVSACFSGGFIDYLKDDGTLIFTAADEESTSFGCSEESEMTYFGKAFFKEVFAKGVSDSLVETFEKAVRIIEQWETDEKLDASNPLMYAPEPILMKLKDLH